MGTKCNGCDSVIYDISYMECSQENCKKLYHLKCLAITEKTFELFTQEYKSDWRCPECVRDIPKRGNSDTPVRGLATMNQTFTPNAFVSTQRGGSCRNNELQTDDDEMKILAEIREFRLEMRMKMVKQTEEYESLKNRFMSTESELQKLRSMLEVVQEKANKVDTLKIEIKELKKENEQLRLKKGCEYAKPQGSPQAIKSFANVTKHSLAQAKLDHNSASRTASQGKAMEIAVVPMEIQLEKKNSNEQRDTQESQENKKEKSENEKWTTVTRKSRYQNSQVRRGDNVGNSDIQGTERKKFLHVWRLKKATTQENMEKHVRNICGKEVDIKVDRIKHKSERDYASFIIGVPESQYDLLCQSDKWPLNIEFCEWVWFRKSNNMPRSQ